MKTHLQYSPRMADGRIETDYIGQDQLENEPRQRGPIMNNACNNLMLATLLKTCWKQASKKTF